MPILIGSRQTIHSEYIRERRPGSLCLLKPLAGTRHVSVRERRTAIDWAPEIAYLSDTLYPDAEKIILVMDNLNTHHISLLYKAFPAAEARRIVKRLEVHYPPIHGSWLNIAEIELNVMTRQCLKRRINKIGTLRQELGVWERERNAGQRGVNWQFTTSDVRIRLITLHPKRMMEERVDKDG